MLDKVCNQMIPAIPLSTKQAASYEKRIVPIDTDNFRYLRFRAIGNLEKSGFNGNSDGFLYQDFEDEKPGYGYRSFIGKRAHVEHNSSLGLAGSIGDLPDAFLNRFRYPDDVSVKKWADLEGAKHNDTRLRVLGMANQALGDIEVLMRIDTQLVKSAQVDEKVQHLLDRIVRMVDTGQMLTCSMGTNCEYSICSVCGNKARFASEYCEHLDPQKKGFMTLVQANHVRDLLDKELLRPEWLPHICVSSMDGREILRGQSNKTVPLRNAEINRKLSFFELSIVATPAFTDARMLEKLARRSDEGMDEYFERLYKEIGHNNVVDLFGYLKKQGVVASTCDVS